MTKLPRTPAPGWQWPSLREIRLASGLVLGVFLTTHYINHAMGLSSVEAMEEGRVWFNLLWRSWFGTLLLYGAVFTHFALALVALYRRQTLRMPVREALQLAFGLLLPFLLIPHVTGTRIAFVLTGWDASYDDVIEIIGASTDSLLRQTAALVIAWAHFCVGLHFWFRSRAWYPPWALPLYSLALLVPVFALIGLAEAAADLEAGRFADMPVGQPPDPATLAQIRIGLYLFFASSIAATFAARWLRSMRAWRSRVEITYPGGRVVIVPRGFSVLEASRSAGIPHMSVCGGRGRCSTCRFRVLQGQDHLPPPNLQERATLTRIKATPNIRLACQVRPASAVAVAPLLVLDQRRSRLPPGTALAQGGRECEIAVLFCDLRGFTALAEHRLPFDTVFILNRFFDVVGHAVEESGGHVDKFIGDGALALFGLDDALPAAARQALQAAARIGKGVADLNRLVGSELDRPLRIAMGLHCGTAIVGEMGYGRATTLTAIGDALNTASRLETFAKEMNAELVVSEELRQHAGIALAAAQPHTLEIRGKSTPMPVWIVPTAAA